MIRWQIQKLHPEATLPSKKHPEDAGWDIVTVESYTLAPNEHHVFPTGFAAAFPPEFVAVIKDRSSLGSQGIHTMAGVIDAGYRGEWKIVLRNTSAEPFQISAGDRIAQCLFVPVPVINVKEVTALDQTKRGAGGFGSTGK